MHQRYTAPTAAAAWLLVMTSGVSSNPVNLTEAQRTEFLEIQAQDISRPTRCGDNRFCFMLEMRAIEASISDEFTDEQIRACWAANRADTTDQARRVIECARASK